MVLPRLGLPGLELGRGLTLRSTVTPSEGGTGEYVPQPPQNVAWASTAADTTPDFDIDLPAGAEAGDTLRAEVSVAGADDWSEYFLHTITAQNIIDDAFTIPGVEELAEGDYEFRFRIARGEAVSEWTALVEVTINLAPTVSTLSPADDATDVAVDASLVVTFNKNVQFGTGTIDVYATTGDVLIESFDVETDVGTDPGEVSISGAAVTINLTDPLDGETDYYVQIDATAIENLNDIAFAGIADETTWNFTTAATFAAVAVDNAGAVYGVDTSWTNGGGASKTGHFSFWFYVDEDTWPAASKTIFNLLTAGGNTTLLVTTASTGRLVITGRNASNTVILARTFNNSAFAVRTWYNLIVSYNMASGVQVWVTTAGVSEAEVTSFGSSTTTDDSMAAHGRASVFALPGGTGLLDGFLSQLFIDTQNALDLSVEANRRDFVGANFKPVDISAEGSPQLRLINAVATWFSNTGSADSLTETGGSLAEAASSPSD